MFLHLTSVSELQLFKLLVFFLYVHVTKAFIASKGGAHSAFAYGSHHFQWQNSGNSRTKRHDLLRHFMQGFCNVNAKAT
jgi:hypothetical protein